MSPNLITIRDLLNANETAPSWKYVGGNPPTIVIAAKHSEVGDLRIFDEGSEYTVEIGELHHTHFSHYSYDGDSKEQQLLQAAKDAVQYVIDVVNDRVLFTVDFMGERCIGASSRYIDHESPVGAIFSCYTFLRIPRNAGQSHIFGLVRFWLILTVRVH